MSGYRSIGGPVTPWAGAAEVMAARELERIEQPRAKARRPRVDLSCPTCKTPRALTPAQARKGYQCNRCADMEEGAY